MTLFNFILEGLSADIKKLTVSHHMTILSAIISNINQTPQMVHVTGDYFFSLLSAERENLFQQHVVVTV